MDERFKSETYYLLRRDGGYLDRLIAVITRAGSNPWLSRRVRAKFFRCKPCTTAARPDIKDNEANVAERFGHVPDVSCKPADAAPIEQPEIVNQNWQRGHQIGTTQIRPKAQPAGVIREQRFLKGLATSKDLS